MRKDISVSGVGIVYLKNGDKVSLPRLGYSKKRRAM